MVGFRLDRLNSMFSWNSSYPFAEWNSFNFEGCASVPPDDLKINLRSNGPFSERIRKKKKRIWSTNFQGHESMWRFFSFRSEFHICLSSAVSKPSHKMIQSDLLHWWASIKSTPNPPFIATTLDSLLISVCNTTMYRIRRTMSVTTKREKSKNS